ncbi:hypothetical protein JCM9279_003865 [Rhodotorula babjevae]
MEVALVRNADAAPTPTPPSRPRTFLLPLPPRAIQSRPRPGVVHPPESFRWLGLPEELKLLVVSNVDPRIPTFNDPEPPSATVLALSSTSRWFRHVCKPLVWMVVRFVADEAHKHHRNLQAFETILKHHEEQNSPLPVKILSVLGLELNSNIPAARPVTFVEYAAEGAALARVVEKLASKSLEILMIANVKLEWAQGEQLLRASRTAPRLSVLRLGNVEVWQDPDYLRPARNAPARRTNAGTRAAAIDTSIASSISSMALSSGRVTRSMRRPLVLWTLSERYEERPPPLLKRLQIFNSHDMFFTLVNEANDLHSLAYWPAARESDDSISMVLRHLPHLRTLSLGGNIGASALRILASKIKCCSDAGIVLPLEELIFKGPCTNRNIILLVHQLVHLPALRVLAIDDFRSNTAAVLDTIAEGAPRLEQLTLVAGDRSSSAEYLAVFPKFRKLEALFWDFRTPQPDPTALIHTQQLELETMTSVARACPLLLAMLTIVGSGREGPIGYAVSVGGRPERLIEYGGEQVWSDFLFIYNSWMLKRLDGAEE